MKKVKSLFKWSLIIMSIILTSFQTSLKAQAPSCNLIGPLKACLSSQSVEIIAEIEFGTANPTLDYSFPLNTSGSYIISKDAYELDPFTGTGRQKLLLYLGDKPGQINLQLDVTTDKGSCECSKSITIITTIANAIFTPILCYDETSTLTVHAEGSSNFSYTYNLFPGDVKIGPKLAATPSADFLNLKAGEYQVIVKGSNGCSDTANATITQPDYNPIIVNCTNDTSIESCLSQDDVNSKFSEWLSKFSYSGGTNTQLVIAPENPEPPKSCGGKTTISWIASSDCKPYEVICTKTFTVESPNSLKLNCPPQSNQPKGQTQQSINSAFQNWLNSVNFSGGCNPQLSNNATVAPDACGGETTVTWTLIDKCDTITCQSKFIVESCTGSIGDFVWNDLNANGVQDTGEPGLSGICVQLTGTGIISPISTTTDVNGKYLFSGLQAGNYCVSFCKAPGFDLTTANGGIDNVDSDALLEYQPICVTLAQAENNLTIDAGYVPTTCYEPCDGDTRVGAVQSIKTNVQSNTITIKVTFNKEFADNTYGTNAIGWTNGHTFGNLTGSDHLMMALYNGAGVKTMEFKLDYITADLNSPSGFSTLGVLGGEGRMFLGSSSDVVSVRTSLSENFNTFGYKLPVNSPQTNLNYTPNPTYPNWIYDVWYEVTVKKSAFGTAGFDSVGITGIHASPSKTGSNTACVQPCKPLAISLQSNNGACASNCKGSINLTAAHGKKPYTIVWSGPNGFTSQVEDPQNLCPGSYSVTVTDAAGISLTQTATVSTPPQTNCINRICFASPTKSSTVNGNHTWTIDPVANTVTIRTTLSRSFVDNTYGINSIGWNVCGRTTHKFNDLTGSDKLQLALFDASGVKRIEFAMDYISSSSSVPSGFKTLGVTGGDGKMILGTSSNVVKVSTSIDDNFNKFGYVLTSNSPQTNSSYTPNALYPNWIWDVWYEVTVKLDVFGTSGFGKPQITNVHASPSKSCVNEEPVVEVPCVTARMMEENLDDNTTVENNQTSPATIIIENDMKIFPNPTSNEVQVSFIGDFSKSSKLFITDINGRVVSEIQKIKTSENQITRKFDTTNLPNGIYVVQLHTDRRVLSKRLVIQK